MGESAGTSGSLGKGFVQDYTDLLVYRISFKLSKEIFEVTKLFPKEEVYSLTDQFRRAIRPRKMNETLLELGAFLNGVIERSSAFVIGDDRAREDPSIDEFF